ncbi:MAG: hypothetical protein EPO22_06630 [Dehalococcoidia bacterium]|nr:MAG: hypothetical protein EPO22_06630 [Dehalococcoidia bacterium]
MLLFALAISPGHHIHGAARVTASDPLQVRSIWPWGRQSPARPLADAGAAPARAAAAPAGEPAAPPVTTKHTAAPQQPPEGAPDRAAADEFAQSQVATPMATASPVPTQPPAPAATPAPPPSVLAGNQLVVFYGSPVSDQLGILGAFTPEDAAARVRDQAAIYDGINGDRGAVPALDLIYEMVQSEPTENGLYLRYLDPAVVQSYLAVAHSAGVQLILDLQIGRGDPLAEVRGLEPFLRDPIVHVAIDPEYAVGPEGVPIETPGTITGQQINDVQDYLAGIVAQGNLPPKMLIIHQYLDGTVVDGDAVRDTQGVSLVLNMDAFGDLARKVEKYRMFSTRSYARHKAFNIFLKHDDAVMSEADIEAIDPQPDVIFYQ